MLMGQHKAETGQVPALSGLRFQARHPCLLVLDHIHGEVNSRQVRVRSKVIPKLLVQSLHPDTKGWVPIPVGDFDIEDPPNGILENTQVPAVHTVQGHMLQTKTRANKQSARLLPGLNAFPDVLLMRNQSASVSSCGSHLHVGHGPGLGGLALPTEALRRKVPKAEALAQPLPVSSDLQQS